MSQVLTINPLQLHFNETLRPQYFLEHLWNNMPQDRMDTGQSSKSPEGGSSHEGDSVKEANLELLAVGGPPRVGGSHLQHNTASPAFASSSQTPVSSSNITRASTRDIDYALPELGTDEWLHWFDQQSREIDTTPSSGSTPHSSSSPLATPEEQWQIVLDRKADASFFYCVKSTRIFCRPTCPSRRPVRDNVEFVVTPEEATQRGYRACRRCRPTEILSASEDRQAEMVLKAQGLLRTWRERGKDKPPTLQELAEETGMSKFYLLRTFKRMVGKTPEAYAKSL